MQKLIIAITADKKSDINSWMESHIQEGNYKAGSNTFVAPYSNDGGNSTTHFVCNWRIDDDLRDIVTEYLDTIPGVTWEVVEAQNAAQKIAEWGLISVNTI